MEWHWVIFLFYTKVEGGEKFQTEYVEASKPL